eukprot:15349652-Ditylum_brightwellii.AAC.1
MGKVRRRAISPNSTMIGRHDDNLLLNFMIYEVVFDDYQVKDYASIIIAENIILQVDNEGNSNVLFDAIIDWKQNDT